MSLDLNHWMNLAVQEAQKALPKDVPVGALVLHQQQIIATGFNQRECHHNITGHAELLAMQQAAQAIGSWRLNDCTLIVTLEPCPMCAHAIIQARIKTLVFGAYQADPQQQIAWPSSIERIGGILEEPCQQLLQTFFKANRL